MIPPDDNLGDDVQPVRDLLSVYRPEASPLELDAVKRRVLARAANGSPKTRSNGFMRSRAAILTTLVFGFVLSSAGAGLAVSGFAGNNQASVAQYPDTPTAQPQGQPNVPEQTVDDQPEEQRVLPDSEDTDVAPAGDEVQAPRQVAAGVPAGDGSTLPFTGFAAIPVLLIGLALLGGGVVMRRSSQTD